MNVISMNDKPIQLLLVGLPYSGKTTFAKEIIKSPNFKHINIDQLKWDAGYMSVGDDDVPDTAWTSIFETADNLIKEYLSNGFSVVCEYAWITKSWRDRARSVATAVGCDTKTIYVKLDPRIIIERWKQNAEAKNRFQWPEKEMQDIFQSFEEPTSEEDVLIYDQSIAPTDWLNRFII